MLRLLSRLLTRFRPAARAARAAQTTGEVVVRTLRLQRLAEEWRRGA